MRTGITRNRFRAICLKQGADGTGGGGGAEDAGRSGDAREDAAPSALLGGGSAGAGGGGGGRGEADAGGSNDGSVEAAGGHGHGHPCGDDDDADAADADAPSELLVPLLEEWRDVLVKHVLARLDPMDCAMLAQVGKPWRAVVQACELPRAGTEGAVKLKLVDFLGSIKMLDWAKANSGTGTCLLDVPGGPGMCVECFQNVPGMCRRKVTGTCAAIARRGQLEVLQWARENGFPWDADTLFGRR
jgi:hypothetical protein